MPSGLAELRPINCCLDEVHSTCSLTLTPPSLFPHPDSNHQLPPREGALNFPRSADACPRTPPSQHAPHQMPPRDPTTGRHHGTPIRVATMGPHHGTPPWDSTMGPHHGTPPWDSTTGPHHGTSTWDPTTSAPTQVRHALDALRRRSPPPARLGTALTHDSDEADDEADDTEATAGVPSVCVRTLLRGVLPAGSYVLDQARTPLSPPRAPPLMICCCTPVCAEAGRAYRCG
jgi:hypothetical protein